MLDDPEIYWGAKFREDIWWRFEGFEGLGLGEIPPMPEGLRASIPEPAGGVVTVLALAGVMHWRQKRVAT